MSYLRARKSIKLGGGVRLNVSKTGFSVSAGGRGGRVTVNSKGRRTTTVGLPGSGVSYVSNSSTRSRRAAPAAAAPSWVVPTKPGLFSPHYEKAFAKGVRAYMAGDSAAAAEAFMEASAADTKNKAIGDDFFAGLVALERGADADAIACLEKVVVSAQQLPDLLMTKYAPGFQLQGIVNDSVTVAIPATNAGASLLLSNSYDRVGRTDEAIGVLQQLVEHDPHPYVVLTLAALYRKIEDWDELIHVTAGITNEDDLTLLIRMVQAEAMTKKGLNEAALEVLTDALRSKKRDATVLKQARYSRAELYLQLGKKAMAKRDFSRIYAEDPNYEDVPSRLAELQ